MHNVKKYFAIFLQMQKIGLMNRTAYRWSFAFMVVSVFLQMVLSVVFINVTFKYIPSVAGWDYHSVLIVVASYMIIEGIMWAFFAQLGAVYNHIYEGTLDGLLLKPIDAQFFVSVWRGDTEDVTRIVTGVALLVYSVVALSLSGWHLVGTMIMYLLLIFNGTVIIYSINMLVRTLNFFVIDARSVWTIIESITRMSQYPTDIFFHKAVRLVAMTIVPLAFIATVPAKVIAFGFDWKLTLSSFAAALIFFLLARAAWKFSLKHYSSASS